MEGKRRKAAIAKPPFRHRGHSAWVTFHKHWAAKNPGACNVLRRVGLLDAYVAVSNTNVHLRASQGRPSHVVIPNPPEYRWMHTGDQSPWFPGTRIYRQHRNGDWSEALEKLAADLAE